MKLSAVVYGATACATKSLQYEGVTYVTKVVFKSAKLIPTMIVGVILDARAEKAGRIVQRREYGIWQYTSAFLLCLGAAGFCMSPNDLAGVKEEKQEDVDYDNRNEMAGEEGNLWEGGIWEETEEFIKGQINLNGHWIGISLLALSVVCDALVPNLQQQLMHGIGGSSAPSLPRKNSEEDNQDIEMRALVKQRGGNLPSSRRNNGASNTNHTGGLTPPSSPIFNTNTNSIDEEMIETKSLIKQPSSPRHHHHHKSAAHDTGGGLSPMALMVNINSIGFTLLLVSTIFRSAFLPIVSFIAAHPHFLALHLTVGMGLGTAVLAYMQLIKRSGPAVAVAVATLRKVVTVVLSYIIFPKPMTGMHAISVALVGGGLLVGYVGKGKRGN